MPIGAQAYGSPVAAATLPDGTPLEAWAGTLGTWVHAGLVPDAPNHDFQAPLGAYGYDTGLATDTAGRAVLAWYSNASGHLGVYAQDVAADGSPVGAAVNLPGTANMKVGQIGRTTIVARPGGRLLHRVRHRLSGQKRIRLWKVGARRRADRAHRPRLVRHRRRRRQRAALGGLGRRRGRGPPGPRPALEPLRQGLRRGGRRRPGGQGVPGLPPRRERDRRGPRHPRALLDGHHPDAATYHTRVLPGLTLKSSRLRIPGDKTTSVTFTVLDAGQPVKGARVRAAGESDTTNASGKVTLDLSPATRVVTARASSTGYVGADQDIKVVG